MFIAAKTAKADDFKVSLSKEDLINILQAIHSAKDLNEEKKQLIKELIEIVRYSIPHLSKLKSKENYKQLTSLYKGMNIDSYGNIKTSDIENSIYLAKNS
jgi:dimeric dUTPase (all-alpha-NTP-PPase superfamily)